MREVNDRRLVITVVGAGDADDRLTALAREAGTEIARAGAVLLCGGRGGVMAAAARGAREAGGLAVGVLPGASRAETPPDPHLDLALFTGLGQARNQILVVSADAVVGMGGGWGTLSEIGLALKYRVPVVLLESWELVRPDGAADPLLERAATAPEAVARALRAAEERRAEERPGGGTRAAT